MYMAFKNKGKKEHGHTCPSSRVIIIRQTSNLTRLGFKCGHGQNLTEPISNAHSNSASDLIVDSLWVLWVSTRTLFSHIGMHCSKNSKVATYYQ